MSPLARADWGALTVVDTDAKFLNSSSVSAFGLSTWRPGGDLFRFVTCARQTMATLNENAFPVSWKDNDKVKTYKGPDAYRFLLRYYTGLELCERQEGRLYPDNRASGELRRAWQLHRAKNPNKSGALLPYIEALFHDGNMIKSSILSYSGRQPTISNAAASLAGLDKGKVVLVIGGDPALTRNILAALGHGKSGQPSKITVVSAEDDEQKIRKNLRGPKHKRLTTGIDFIGCANETTERARQFDAIIMCPQHFNENAPAFVWLKNGNATAPVLVNTSTINICASSHYPNIVTPDKIRERKDNEVARITELRHAADEAILSIVAQRVKGMAPAALKFDPATHRQSLVLRRIPERELVPNS